jgi:P27 family predicted phage terminase small subunit
LVPVAILPRPEPPDAPKGLLPATRRWWSAFWESRIAEMVEPSDIPAVTRLATLRDERERCYRSARKNRLVAGYQGAAVLNPLYKHMQALDSEIRQLEDRFGLSPMARLKLGVQFGEAARSLEDLNRIAAINIEGEEDPRQETVRRVRAKKNA